MPPSCHKVCSKTHLLDSSHMHAWKGFSFYDNFLRGSLNGFTWVRLFPEHLFTSISAQQWTVPRHSLLGLFWFRKTGTCNVCCSHKYSYHFLTVTWIFKTPGNANKITKYLYLVNFIKPINFKIGSTNTIDYKRSKPGLIYMESPSSIY